jgi:hypothetical protein
MKLIEKKPVEALQICALIEQQCSGTELAKTGELFRGLILGGMPGYHSAAVRVAEDILSRNPADAEAHALYYSLTHTYPATVPKKADATSTPELMLYANYPNPFNLSTVINFSLPIEMHVRLYVRDLTGRIVKTLYNNVAPQGMTSVTLHAGALQPTMLFYTLETPRGSTTRRMLLSK